jgi:hypothetical protein
MSEQGGGEERRYAPSFTTDVRIGDEMKGKRLAVVIVCVIQLIVLAIWIMNLAGTSPHKGTVINLGLFALAAILGLVTQANGKFKVGVIVLNWIEVIFWMLGLFPALAKVTESAEMRSALGSMVAMTLGIIISCVANGILLAMLPKKN